MALSVAGLLLLPAAWATSVTANTSLNTTLPQAGPQEGASGGTFGSQQFDSGSDRLAAWLRAHRDPSTSGISCVANSQSGSRLIAQYGLSVMSLGRVPGSDNTTTVAQFADRVPSGSVRYVQVTQGGGRGAGGFGGTRTARPGATGNVRPGARRARRCPGRARRAL